MDVDTLLTDVGGEYGREFADACPPPTKGKFCAYLCYSHPSYGTAVVPKALWSAAQAAEAALWARVAKWERSSSSNDRAVEHWKAFANFASLPSSFNLGRTIEVGAGPWTQLKGILYVRSDLQVSEFTVWEPGAKRYMNEVDSCSYKSGDKLLKWDAQTEERYHSFPVVVNSDGGELLAASSSFSSSALLKNKDKQQQQQQQQYDTLISINVLEHVQNAFEYLTGLYLALRSGGLLILHERYYNADTIVDGDNYHPVRVTKHVLDHFLSGFEVLFNNCSASYEQRVGEQGYYVIARKK